MNSPGSTDQAGQPDSPPTPDPPDDDDFDRTENRYIEWLLRDLR